MKKFVSGVIAGIITAGSIGFAAQYIADTATFKVMVNGKEFSSDKPIVAIEGSTYLPLKAIGEVLGVPVQWNQELMQVEVGNNVSLNPSDVKNYIVGEVWNKGFWFIRDWSEDNVSLESYISEFAESYDEEFDINKVIAHTKNTKETIDVYNKAYSGQKEWDSFYAEYCRLLEIISKEDFVEKKEKFDTTFFVKTRDDFCKTLSY